MTLIYSGHVCQACEWLQCSLEGDLTAEGTTSTETNCPSTEEFYNDPLSKDAFERIPNKHSNEALLLYLAWRGFQEQVSQSTVEGIHAALKWHWDRVFSGDVFQGQWQYNKMQQHWEGNPVQSGEIDDLMKAIKHKIKANNVPRMHSATMKMEYMDMMLTWSKSKCPFNVLPPGEVLSVKTHSEILWHLEQLVFHSMAWTLWMSAAAMDAVLIKYLDGEESLLTADEQWMHFWVHLRNRKGWQKKLDGGMRDINLQMANQYRLYPRPQTPTCDSFLEDPDLTLALWIKWVEHIHLRCPMSQTDFMFPLLGPNGVLQPGKVLLHKTIQKLLNKATTGAGIPGTFSTHCFWCGGAQYCFMLSPKPWLLKWVHWWGGWAEGEQKDTLMQYLLDELNAHENDHSDALALEQPPAGEAALAQPATMEMAHHVVSASQMAMSDDVKSLREQLGEMANCSLSNCVCPGTWCLLNPSPLSVQSSNDTPNHAQLPSFHLNPATNHDCPTLLSSQAAGQHSAPSPPPPSSLPLSQLVLHIPNVPILLEDGMSMLPKLKSWRVIMSHWTEGAPQLGLPTPLKDWPHKHYNGANWQFNQKYLQHKMIVMEFLNEFEGNKANFLCTTQQGHTAVHKAIQDAHKQYGRSGEHCCVTLDRTVILNADLPHCHPSSCEWLMSLPPP
ncbi:hypothetical protein SCLCIDRAFT_126125 [Scleroderma citrinum Foug A]|uniref:Uncharacterized protein n=1 Tax=Scleroderma citrinum Foug A TaxID=1036808 RepID=A0A0C3DTD2_9AGAM|nr:hypothetical protein SCLCIDRAFT_126125 [Scleroderma citrinum Foug A]